MGENILSIVQHKHRDGFIISMAFSKTIFSSSSLPLLRSRSFDFGATPNLDSFTLSPICTKLPHLGIAISRKKNLLHAAPNGINAMGSTSLMSEKDSDSVPMPIVMIDQDSDPSATIVQVSFGDRLGALIDTMKALKDLGLDVAKGTVSTNGPVKQTKIYLTRLDNGRKVEDFDLLEMVRLTIINNLLKYHPESSEKLAMGEAFGIKGPEKKLDVDIATRVLVKGDGPKRSLLYTETADRPGLLLEMIKVISDTNIDVESAEIDTEGLVAKDTFHVSYRGAALNSSVSGAYKLPALLSPEARNRCG